MFLLAGSPILPHRRSLYVLDELGSLTLPPSIDFGTAVAAARGVAYSSDIVSLPFLQSTIDSPHHAAQLGGVEVFFHRRTVRHAGAEIP